MAWAHGESGERDSKLFQPTTSEGCLPLVSLSLSPARSPPPPSLTDPSDLAPPRPTGPHARPSPTPKHPPTPNPNQNKTTAARAAAAASAAAAESTSGRAAPCATAPARAFAASGPKPEVVPNPLQAIVPPIIAAVGATVRGVQKGLPAARDAALSSGAARSAVAWFADRALLSGYFLAPKHLDLPKWATFLAAGGYSDRGGWSKVVEAVRPKAESGELSAEEAEALVAALHKADCYDKSLFTNLAKILRSKFTEASTEGLCAAIEAFAANGHFDAGLWDDAADGIAYCNHYLAPTTVPLPTLCAVLSAYAKYKVDRADLFVALTRAISEDRLRPLPDSELSRVASSLLASFKALDFWPDVTEALVLAAKTRPGVSVDASLLDAAAKKLGGSAWLEGGYKDPEHFHGRAFGEYNMYVLRDELTPKYYSPAAARADVEGGKKAVAK